MDEKRKRLVRVLAVKRSHIPSVLLLAFMFSLVFVPVSGYEENEYDEVDRDSYTSRSYKDSNYGRYIYLYCGNGTGQYDVFMHFTLANRPLSYSAARLRFSAWDVLSKINVSLWTVSNSWGEDTITGANQPSLQMLLTRTSIMHNGWVEIDVTDHVRRVPAISFCLTPSGAADFIYIFSREYILADYTPYIEYTYEITSTTPGYNTWVVIGIIAMVSTVIGYQVRKSKNF